MNRCTSCGIPLAGEKETVFDCPNCGEAKIGRCKNCRDQSANYICPSCGWVGP